MKLKLTFGFVYVLILITQFPHVWQAYADIERDGFYLTAAGAALGFELSTAVFTYRLVTGSTRKWTRRGVRFFIASSVMANLAYYNVLGGIMREVTPFLFAVALPVALALYAEEFGAEVKREERRSHALQPTHDASHDARISSHVCAHCGASFEKSTRLAAHVRWEHVQPSKNGKQPVEVEAADRPAQAG
ncbi:MAG TPA: hypothetical protein VJ793_05645 [Anaerolineae bacterium]|nr:hypothetical protein [Anaerolineae bacterium]